ncbi:MAG: DUF2256 domain-containing protein [Chloroflexota bacterium]
MSAKDRRRAEPHAGERRRTPSQRPTKTCPVCGRPFSWRRRWAESWDQVVYCSERCRRRRHLRVKRSPDRD